MEMTLTIDSGAGDVSVGVVGGGTALSGLVINVSDAEADNGNITIAGIGDDILLMVLLKRNYW